MSYAKLIASAISCSIIIFSGVSHIYAATSQTEQGATEPATKTSITSFDEAKNAGLISDILFKVISREGQSKKYTDVIPLDGGTVGIAHFAVGGLGDLYNEMDTIKYFGKPTNEMISKYSAACRPAGKSGNDRGWGCYSKAWWRDGMRAFVNSPESKQIQDKAWSNKMKPVIELALSHHWNTPRSIAIALGIANSIGEGGFKRLAARNHWDAESTLNAYVGSNEHRLRRKQAIDQHYPR